MDTRAMPQTGQYRRVGKFELHELIGEGAMGTVWKAYDSVIRRFVALKLLPRAGRSADARDRFMREARAAGALQHPNIVTIYDLGESDDQLFIAMELVDGRDLSSLIALSEPLALERKLDMVIEVLQGLSYAHERGVIHRDVKPSNVRIASDGSVKIMDFGIARLQSADVTGSGAIVGTPTYMAPEQITNGAITPATDIFAVGCVLYELLAYHKPFEGETVHGVLDQLLTCPVPAHLNAALVAQRDSALAARERAARAGAMKNNVPSLILAETVVQNAERALRTGDLARAASGYLSAIPQYVKAQAEAEALRRDAEQAIARATPVVHALATRPEAGRAATSLARADSLYLAMDYVVSRLAALDAEQVGVAAGVAPPSPQPPEARAAIAVLLQDLERAVSSERVGNLQVLMPGMAEQDVAAWQAFFERYKQLTARYGVERLSTRADTAYAMVRTLYLYVPTDGGAQRETRLRQAIRFIRTANGWRIANIRQAP